MNTWSMKKKLVSLCLGLIGLTLTVGFVSCQGLDEIIAMKDGLADVQMPSIKHVLTIRGRQDGIMLDMYSALYLIKNGTPAQRNLVLLDLEEDLKDIDDAFLAFDKLDATPEVEKQLLEVKPILIGFSKEAKDIVDSVFAGNDKDLTDRVSALEEKYDTLHEEMPKVVALIEAKADEADQQSVVVQNKTKLICASLILLGTAAGLLLSLIFVRSLVNHLNKTIEELNASSGEMSSSSNLSAASSTELSESAAEQAASLQETVASIEEISAMINQNSASAEKMKTAVDINQASSDDGAKSVADMLSAIGEIKNTNDEILHQMEASNREFAAIVKIISEIGDKTKVINDIVFQTKLLSFNASVEAARAGEHGKGFAVVAEEVGNLAQMSGNAAKEITDMLSGSIKQVNEIVQQTTSRVDRLVEAGKDKITMGESTAQRCHQALTKISDNARNISSMINEITSASKEQAQGVQEINKAMTQLDQVVQQNATVAQQSSQQAEALNSEAQKLANTVAGLVSVVTGATSQQRVYEAESPRGASIHSIRDTQSAKAS